MAIRYTTDNLASGLMDRDITVQTATVSVDPTTGQDVQTWPPDGGSEEIVAAQWLPETTDETWRARQIDATILGTYKMYDMTPRPSPDATRIIDEEGRIFDVKGVTEIRRGRGLIVTVAARAESL